VRQIYPVIHGTGTSLGQEPVDLAVAYAYPPPDRADPAGTVKPADDIGAHPAWVRANMVASVDGAAAVADASAGLSGAADRLLFMTLRGLADVIVVGSRTARIEDYGPARPRDDWARLRAGRPPTPPIAVITSKLEVNLASRLFTEAPPHARTIVVTTSAAPPGRRSLAAQHARVVIAGDERVDLRAAVTALGSLGLTRMLTEGGPGLLGQLVLAGLLDELCLTVSPLLAGGGAGRILTGPALSPLRRLRLARVLEDNGSLFCRYVRAAEPGPAEPGPAEPGPAEPGPAEPGAAESDKDASS
jgi:riboflavin biosynthesis pyrimidine reductase